jgi:hypothetical protein
MHQLAGRHRLRVTSQSPRAARPPRNEGHRLPRHWISNLLRPALGRCGNHPFDALAHITSCGSWWLVLSRIADSYEVVQVLDGGSWCGREWIKRLDSDSARNPASIHWKKIAWRVPEQFTTEPARLVAKVREHTRMPTQAQDVRKRRRARATVLDRLSKHLCCLLPASLRPNPLGSDRYRQHRRL